MALIVHSFKSKDLRHFVLKVRSIYINKIVMIVYLVYYILIAFISDKFYVIVIDILKNEIGKSDSLKNFMTLQFSTNEAYILNQK